MYNGHRNYNEWNQALWIANDEGLYNIAKDFMRRNTKEQAAFLFLETMLGAGEEYTPDGVKWTKTGIRNGLVGL